jgi:hypothetical protein
MMAVGKQENHLKTLPHIRDTKKAAFLKKGNTLLLARAMWNKADPLDLHASTMGA